MRNRIIVTTLTLLMALGIHAQQEQTRVFRQIYSKAYKTANDPKEDISVRKLAVFRVDAITYLQTKALEELTDSTRELSQEEVNHINSQLDSMAFFMHDYVNLFVKEYTRAATEKQKDRVIKMFSDASMENPLYKDPDEELVLSYYNRKDFLTRFSLDTDWVKAEEAVKEKLKK